MSKEKDKSLLPLLIKSIVSIGLLTWFAFSINWVEAWNTMKHGKPIYLLASFIAIQLTVLSSVWKWKISINSFDKQYKKTIKFTYLSRLYYIGLFFNNFLPSSIGGDVMRIFYLGKKIGNVKAGTSVALERITSGLAMIVIVLVAALFFDKVRPFLTTVYIILGIIVGAVLFFMWALKKSKGGSQTNIKWLSKLQKIFLEFGTSLIDFKKESKTWWLQVIILSFAFQFGMAWINQLLFKSFGIDVPFYQLLVFITLISIITMLPISVNGLGVREAGYLLFFKEIGMVASVSVSVSLLFFILVAISSLAGGVFWLLERRIENEALGK